MIGGSSHFLPCDLVAPAQPRASPAFHQPHSISPTHSLEPHVILLWWIEGENLHSYHPPLPPLLWALTVVAVNPDPKGMTRAKQ
jgi:hypothetical protein